MRKFLFYLAGLLAFGFSIAQAGYLTPDLKAKVEKAAPTERLKVIVRIEGKADLSGFYQEQREAMVQHLKTFAEGSQRALLSSLPGYGDKVSMVHPYWIYNGIAMEATPDVVEALAKRSDVSYIEDDKIETIDSIQTGDGNPRVQDIEWNITRIEAPHCWSHGITGEGVIVGNIDTGVDPYHFAFDTRWRGGSDSWFDAIKHQTTPYDDNGHGTFTMGVICGNTASGIGVAPNARFVMAKGFDFQNHGSDSEIDACFQWIAGLTTDAPDVVNNSWSNTNGSYTHFWDEVVTLQEMGIYQVFSNGNTGPNSGTVNAPASYPYVFGVGATDNNYQIANFSSRGPSPTFSGVTEDPTKYLDPNWASSRRKPDLSAPGVSIRSAWLSGGYQTLSGTSMAAPHVTGSIALLLQRFRDLSKNINDKIAWQRLTQPPRIDQVAPGLPDNNYGWGELNVAKAVGELPSPSYLTVVPLSQVSSAYLSWDRSPFDDLPPAYNSTDVMEVYQCQRNNNYGTNNWINLPNPIYWPDNPNLNYTDNGYGSLPVGYRISTYNGLNINGSGVKSNEFWLGLPPPGDPVIAQSSDSLATAYPNGRKVVLDRKDRLNVVFTSGDTVYYTSSNKKAKKWSAPVAVGLGKFPAIALDSHDSPHVLWTSGTQVLSSQLSNGIWATPYSLFSSSGATVDAPSFVINTANDSGFASWTEATTTSSDVSLASFMPGDTTRPVSIQRVDSAGSTSFASPSLALDPTGKVMLTWSRDGVVYFQERGGTILNLSQSPGNLAIHPVVDAYGDRVSVTWQEQDSVGAFKIKQAVKEDGTWGAPQVINLFTGNALFPATAGASQVAFSSDVAGRRDIYYQGTYEDGGVIYGTTLSASSDGLSHNYPSVTLDNDWPNATLHCVWTDVISTGIGFPIAIKSIDIVVPPVPLVFVDAGKAAPSSHTIQRAGTVSFGSQPYLTADTHPQKLIYRFSGLNPNKRYRLGVTYYFEKSEETWRMNLKVDGRDGMRTRIPTNTRVDESDWLPRSVYQDGVINVEITPLEGDFALCNELALYEFGHGKGGGPQEEGWTGKPLPLTYALSQSYPNPFNEKATIAYQLPEEAPVSLKVYNVAGQMVRELASGKQKAGYYNAVWDGKDGSGRSVSSGVYFYRLDAGGFSKTNKLVVVR